MGSANDLALAADPLIEDVHFDLSFIDPYSLGRKPEAMSFLSPPPEKAEDLVPLEKTCHAESPGLEESNRGPMG